MSPIIANGSTIKRTAILFLVTLNSANQNKKLSVPNKAAKTRVNNDFHFIGLSSVTMRMMKQANTINRIVEIHFIYVD